MEGSVAEYSGLSGQSHCWGQREAGLGKPLGSILQKRFGTKSPCYFLFNSEKKKYFSLKIQQIKLSTNLIFTFLMEKLNEKRMSFFLSRKWDFFVLFRSKSYEKIVILYVIFRVPLQR